MSSSKRQTKFPHRDKGEYIDFIDLPNNPKPARKIRDYALKGAGFALAAGVVHMALGKLVLRHDYSWDELALIASPYAVTFGAIAPAAGSWAKRRGHDAAAGFVASAFAATIVATPVQAVIQQNIEKKKSLPVPAVNHVASFRAQQKDVLELPNTVSYTAGLKSLSV